ncbi:BON domain-containing protein [Massilia pinisoli]|uniref:BON domain-containing protein n=1 Tax=Massilia pinisoli TaxID=1772194 RepID=A0ABT1ZW73_9BURK|nr:BON domain-containing protein [Massilia pinisoli]MCS0584129.1 BON domain-containing protein [Massilia pinisoli]
MKTLIATLLATAAGASFAAAPTAALNHDPATYRNLTQKAESAYRAATAKCDAKSGNDKDVCMADARLTRTRTEADALSKYNHTAASHAKARANVADAEYDLAKAKCDAKSGADKDSCMDNAKSVHTAALADVKAERTERPERATAVGSSGGGATGASGGGNTSSGGLVTGTDTRDPAKAAAVDKCAQMSGDAKTSCLVETKPSAVRENAADATEHAASKTHDTAVTAADKTKAAAATVVEKTKEVAHAAAEKTKDAASTVAQKTENAMDRARDHTRDDTRQAASTTTDKTHDAATKTRLAASDTAITTKVKADLVKEPNLDSLGIHVETEKGVVMLSGFVNSKDEADKAVKVAKGVDGVTSVKSAIKVK